MCDMATTVTALTDEKTVLHTACKQCKKTNPEVEFTSLRAFLCNGCKKLSADQKAQYQKKYARVRARTVKRIIHEVWDRYLQVFLEEMEIENKAEARMKRRLQKEQKQKQQAS
jgi:hypothetical protein